MLFPKSLERLRFILKNSGRSSVSKWFIVLIFLGLSVSACDNEVDINADWKETMILYGLLDANQSEQYIKVNKAFLNEAGSALMIAKNSDSLYLESVTVKIIRSKTGEEYILTRVNEISKDSGIFANDVNYLYKMTDPVYENEMYELVVESGKTGQIAKAVTYTLGKTKIEAPFRTSNPIFSLGANYIFISYVPAINSYAYDIKMLVEVQEFNRKDTSLLETKNLRWNVITNYRMPQVGAGAPMPTVIHQIERTAFYQFLSTYLTDTSDNIVRRIKSVGMQYYGGNQTLVDYISVNEPAIGIVQKQAEYSNVQNGFGLFAARSMQQVVNVPMDPNSVTYLQKNVYTAPLNFIR